jgi:tetratricopeptide (TPR) repeat protein
MVLVFDRTFVAGSFRAAWRARARLYLGLAATSLVLFALFATSGMGDRSIGYPAGRSWFDYPRVETGVLLHYFRLGFWPSPLVFDYGEEVAVPPLGMLAANVLVLALVFAGIGFALRKRWAAGFLGCWFFLIFAPTSSVVPIVGQPIAENRLYLSLAAVAVALALAATTCLPRRAGTIALASLAIVFGWLTLNRNQVYHTELGIWADTVAKRPGSSRAHLYHASSLLDAGRLDDATRELQATLQLDPRNGTAYANLGYISFQEKRIDQALSHFQTAVALAPNIPSIRTAYGGALFHAGRREEALQQYLAAVRLRPALLTARMDAADLMLRLGRPAEAVTMFEETLRLYPNHAGVRSQFAKLQAALQSGTYTPAQPTPPP